MWKRRSPEQLTLREHEVLDLLRIGLTNEEIAQRLGITVAGAKYHVSQILSKLDVESREEAAALSLAEPRPWWQRLLAPLGWPFAAKAVALAAIAGAAAGISVLVWAAVAPGGSVDEVTSAGEASPVGSALALPDASTVLAGGTSVPFNECGSNRDWVQPPIERVTQHHYLKNLSLDDVSMTYRRHFFEVAGGNGALSANQGWLASTGLSQEGLGSYVDPEVPPWGASGSCLFESDAVRIRFYLIGYKADQVYQLRSWFAVHVSPLAKGYTAINIRPKPLNPDAAATFYFVDSAGTLVDTLCSSGTCPPSATCGEWSSASGTLGSTVTRRYGEIRNCGLFRDSWVITTLGGVDSDGVIGVYRCDSSDTSCLDGRNDHPVSGWIFYPPPFPGGITLLGGGDGNKLTVDNAGHQLTFEISTGAFGESSVCGVSLAPAEKAGPLKMRFGSGTVCWTDVESEASYKVEGSVHYVSGGCDGHIDAPGSEEIPFSVILAANSTSFSLPRPQDPRLTFANAVTVSIRALDASGATLLTDGTGVLQRDNFCQPSPTP